MKFYIPAPESTIGSMLAQEDDDYVERAIFYLSKIMNDAETGYTMVDNFCLSLYFSCTKLKHYIKSLDMSIY